ncbi:phage tail spike protein, partial [Niallia circulans]
MPNLLIFDPADNFLAVLSNEAEEACAFWDAPFKEMLNQGSTFEFMADGTHEDSKYIIAENQVAFIDKDGAFRLFVIKEPERIDGESGPEIHAICEPAMLELNDEIITDVRPYNTTLRAALTSALNGVRWQVGQTSDNFGLNSTNFYYISVTEAIEKIVNTWGGEIRDRVEIQGNRIVGRYIDILTMRGTDTGKRWEMDKDILSIRHQVQSYPKTALYGRGASLELEDEDGNATGGFSRKISFAEVEWKKANGYPVDKPKGQEWIGDPEALSIYGRPNKDGTTRHRFGIFESSEQEDPAQLLLETW